MTSKSEDMGSRWPKLIGLLLAVASLVAIVALYALDITFLYEPKHLLGLTNTIFTAIIPVVVAFFAARTYLRTGSFSVLLMGCGMLGFGLCAGSAGWLREMQGGANFNVTIYNTGALLGSLCHITGAAINYSGKPYEWELKRQKRTVMPAYAAIIVFAVLLSFATVQQVIPPFFIQGSGPTPLRQIVLGLAIFLYVLSSLFFMNNYFRIKSDFLYWYSLCLVMLALGLFAFYIEKVVGSPIGWVGRASNYGGTIFSLIAILAAVRSGKSKGLPLEEVISSFFVDAEANFKSLVETASDAIISFDQEKRVILWNSSAEKIFGYAKAEAIGSPLFGMFIPEEYANTLKELVEISEGMSPQKTVEIVGAHKNGRLFPIELSAFERKLPNGRVSTCILRDITERRRAEEALRESRSQLDLALRSANMGVWHWDLVEDKRFFDDQVCHLLGIDPAKFTGTAEEFYQAVHPEDREMLKVELARTIEQDVPYETEYRAFWPDGSVHYIVARAKLFLNEIGKPVRVDGLIWDITEHKLAMAALLESRAKLEAALASMIDAVFISDAEGRFVDFNDAFATHYRFKNKDECLKTLAEYPEILDVFMADGQLAPLDQWAVPRALRGETVTNAEYTLRRKDTGETWVGSYSFGPIRDKDGRIVGSVVAGRDITERKQMEEELRRSHDELELRVRERTAELISANEDLQKQAALLNLAHDAIFVVDSAGVVSFWNKGAEDLYGFTGEQAIGNVACEFLQTRFPESLEQVVKQVIDTGQWAGELRHTTSRGEELVVESRWALRPGRDGEPAGFLEVNHDVTARKVAEEALRSNMARLELVNAELQEFAFVASHDLQEPLRKIQTFCDMAQKRCAPVLDGASKDYLDRVVNSAGRMRQLLRDLLDFSRVATRIEPFKKIDLAEIVREAADVFEASVKETGCQIEIENMPAVEADETQMLGLFQNLIGNALKFRGAETPHIKIYGRLDRKRICEIFVRDNGIGFGPQFAELIFKPFQRLHSRSEYDGTGMGLAICRKIVERHGGTIRAESEPGKGSTFIISLPVKQGRWEGI